MKGNASVLVPIDAQASRTALAPEMMGATGLIGRSQAMKAVRHLIEKVAPTDATVLILGESGTGKELVARAIHRQSVRADKPFIAVNAAALSPTLLESQLFGHVRGAFTGAIETTEGLFVAARGGTLFLDEIGDMPLELQAKLLRAIEEKEVLPIGRTIPTKTDIRILAATNQNLKAKVADGTFRADLYWRLRVFVVGLPPLRDRAGDIIELATHLVNKICKRLRRPPVTFTAEALTAMTRNAWPGNVRELENAIEHAVILAHEQQDIGLEHLSLQMDEEAFQWATAWPEARADRQSSVLSLKFVDEVDDAHASNPPCSPSFGKGGTIVSVQPSTPFRG